MTPRNGFAQAVTLSVSGLPPGITDSFSTNPVSVGQTANLILNAASGTLPNTANIKVSGSTGSLSDSETISLSIVALSPPVTSRSAHVYFDGLIREIVYDPVHRLVFCANPSMNEVEVVSAATQTTVTNLKIPQAYSLAVTPDGSKLWVGTVGDYVYAVDIASMQVVAKATPPPMGFLPLTTVRALVATANGSLLMRMGQFNTTAEGLFQYFPSTGQYKDRSQEASAWRFFRSADGTKVLLANFGTVILYDSASDSFSRNSSINGSPLAAIRNDGTQIAMRVGASLVFLDTQLQQVGSVTVTTGAQSGTPVYSADGKMVYFPQDISIIRGDATFTAIDSNTFTAVGQVPDLFFMPDVIDSCSVIDVCDSAPGGTTLRTSEESGLLIGPSPYGLGFIDSSNPRSLPTSHAAFNLNFPSYTASPNAGATGENTSVVLNGAGFLSGASVSFGGVRGAVSSVSADQTMMQVVAPEVNSQGPVNITASFSDTWATLAPLSFSFGPHVQYFLPMGDAPSGGSQMILFGYGFGSDASQISVSVGSSKAQVVGSSFVAQGLHLPLYVLNVTVPAGVSGQTDISVTTASGSTVLANSFHYWQSVRSLNLGNSFTAVLYDGKRQRVYLLDPVAKSVEAVSPVTGQVVMTAPTGAQARDMTLTPDGSILIVANSGDDTLSLINPDSPVAPTILSVAIPNDANGLQPGFVAATSNGKVFISYLANSSTATSVQILDLVTHSLAPIAGNALFSAGPLVIRSIKGGAQLFIANAGNSGGAVGIYDPVTNSFLQARQLQDFLFDPAAASDGTRMVVNDQYILDAGVKVEGQISIPVLIASSSPFAVNGTLIHASGGLMYLPLTNGLHIYDLAHASLLRSYAGLNLSTAADKTIAIDDAGQSIFAITPSGLQIAQLDSVPLSIGHVDPGVVGSGGGSSITVRGSGFATSTTLVIGGVTIAHQFVDANTLTANLPALPTGSLRVSVANTNGDQFDLDDALRVQ